MTIGIQPEGKLVCPWQLPGKKHTIVWVAASFGESGTTEHYRCTACPRVLHLTNGVIRSEPGNEVIISMAVNATWEGGR